MSINLDKIKDIYGLELLDLVKENIEDINNNINYLIYLNFNDIEDIFERYTPIFICGHKEFRQKMAKLVNKIGIDYVDIIENDLGILEELL